MKIPQTTEIIELKLESGERVNAVVDSVTQFKPGIPRLWLLIARAIPKGGASAPCDRRGRVSLGGA